MLRPLILLAGLLGAGVTLAKDVAGTPDLVASDAHRASMRLVHGLMSDSRYSIHARPLAASVDPAFAGFVDALDAQRLFLAQSDVRALDAARADLAGTIAGKDELEPVFAVFRKFIARVDERTAFARARLLEPADYAAAGTWIPDRSALPRAADTGELDEVWRRLVRNDRLELHLAGQSDEAIQRTLDLRYAELARRMHALTAGDVVESFIDAYAQSVDPGAGYYGPLAPMATYRIDPNLVGVGLQVGRDGPYIEARKIVPGGPADSGDVHPGDRILAIGSGESGEWTDVTGARLDTVVEGMRGKPGTMLRLRLASPAGAQRDVVLARARVQLADEVATRSLVTAGKRRIGVITLPAFYLDFEAARRGDADARSSVSDVARLLRELQADNVDGVILDLRGNGGGSLLESVEMAGLFVGRQPVVQIREAGGRVSVEAGPADTVWTRPVAVLVDEASAAASEIVAAALQDHRRAVVIGERTFGRGSVQNLIDLDRWPSKTGAQYGKAKLTIAEFFRVDGRAIEGVGVEPDVALPDAGAGALRADMKGESGRIAAASKFEAKVAAAPLSSAPVASAAAFQAWRERWLRLRAIEAANALALDAPTRRAAFAQERADATAARQRDDALQAAAVVFAASLPATGQDAGR